MIFPFSSFFLHLFVLFSLFLALPSRFPHRLLPFCKVQNPSYVKSVKSFCITFYILYIFVFLQEQCDLEGDRRPVPGRKKRISTGKYISQHNPIIWREFKIIQKSTLPVKAPYLRGHHFMIKEKKNPAGHPRRNVTYQILTVFQSASAISETACQSPQCRWRRPSVLS